TMLIGGDTQDPDLTTKNVAPFLNRTDVATLVSLVPDGDDHQKGRKWMSEHKSEWKSLVMKMAFGENYDTTLENRTVLLGVGPTRREWLEDTVGSFTHDAYTRGVDKLSTYSGERTTGHGGFGDGTDSTERHDSSGQPTRLPIFEVRWLPRLVYDAHFNEQV